MTYPPQLGFNTSFQCNLVTPHACFCALRGKISLATYVIFCCVICPKVSLQRRDSDSQLAKKRQVEISCLFSIRNGGWQQKQLIARCPRPTKVGLTRQPDNSAARLVSARLGGSEGWELGAASSRQNQVRESTTVLSLGFAWLPQPTYHKLISDIQFHYGMEMCPGRDAIVKRLSGRVEEVSSTTGTKPPLLSAIRWFITSVRC